MAEVIPVGEFDAQKFCQILDEVEERLPSEGELREIGHELVKAIEVQAITDGPPLTEAERAMVAAWVEVVTMEADLGHRIIARLREGFCKGR